MITSSAVVVVVGPPGRQVRLDVQLGDGGEVGLAVQVDVLDLQLVTGRIGEVGLGLRVLVAAVLPRRLGGRRRWSRLRPLLHGRGRTAGPARARRPAAAAAPPGGVLPLRGRAGRRNRAGRPPPGRRQPARPRNRHPSLRRQQRPIPMDLAPKEPGPTAVTASALRSLQRLPTRSPLPLLDGGRARRTSRRPLADRTSRRHRHLSCNRMARNGPYRADPAPKTVLETGRLPRTAAAGTGLPPDNHHRRSRRVGRTTAAAGREFPPETTAPRAGMVPTSVMPCPSSQPPLPRPASPAARAHAADCAPRARSRRRPARSRSASGQPGNQGAARDLPRPPPGPRPPRRPARPGPCQGRACDSPPVHRNTAPPCCPAAAGTRTAGAGWPSPAAFRPPPCPAGAAHRRQQQQRQVAGAARHALAAGRVEHQVRDGGHLLFEFSGDEQPVEACQHGGRPGIGQRERAQRVADPAHPGRGGEPLAHDVARPATASLPSGSRNASYQSPPISMFLVTGR